MREKERDRGRKRVALVIKTFFVSLFVVLDELSSIVLDEKVHGYHSLRVKYSVIACLG